MYVRACVCESLDIRVGAQKSRGAHEGSGSTGVMF